jgi:hypothetical protein
MSTSTKGGGKRLVVSLEGNVERISNYFLTCSFEFFESDSSLVNSKIQRTEVQKSTSTPKYETKLEFKIPIKREAPLTPRATTASEPTAIKGSSQNMFQNSYVRTRSMEEPRLRFQLFEVIQNPVSEKVSTTTTKYYSIP